jgi:hypothetical protein
LKKGAKVRRLRFLVRKIWELVKVSLLVQGYVLKISPPVSLTD